MVVSCTLGVRASKLALPLPPPPRNPLPLPPQPVSTANTRWMRGVRHLSLRRVVAAVLVRAQGGLRLWRHFLKPTIVWCSLRRRETQRLPSPVSRGWRLRQSKDADCECVWCSAGQHLSLGAACSGGQLWCWFKCKRWQCAAHGFDAGTDRFEAVACAAACHELRCGGRCGDRHLTSGVWRRRLCAGAHTHRSCVFMGQ
jgi:hypothetical protein